MYNHRKSGVIQIWINRNVIMAGHDAALREVRDDDALLRK
jgi:hypothetical protein